MVRCQYPSWARRHHLPHASEGRGGWAVQATQMPGTRCGEGGAGDCGQGASNPIAKNCRKWRCRNRTSRSLKEQHLCTGDTQDTKEHARGTSKTQLPKYCGKLREIAKFCGPQPPCVTFRLVVAPLRGPGRSPVFPFACCVGLLLSVGCCGRCSCWCRFRVRGAQ